MKHIALALIAALVVFGITMLGIRTWEVASRYESCFASTRLAAALLEAEAHAGEAYLTSDAEAMKKWIAVAKEIERLFYAKAIECGAVRNGQKETHVLY